MKCLIFEVADEKFAIQIDALVAVTRFLKLRPVDTPTESILGLVNIKGVLQPVVQVNSLFNLPSSQVQTDSRFISISCNEKHFVIVASRVHRFVEVEEENMIPPPESIHSKYISFIIPEEEVEALNVERVFDYFNNIAEGAFDDKP